MKSILVLGSTGSIGTQALEIIRNHGDKFRAAGLSCRSRVNDLIEQIREFRPEAVCVGNAEDASKVDAFAQSEGICLEVYHGEDGLSEIAKMDCDIVLNALMGISGLRPTYEAIKCGRDIALANKETLVAGGAIITGLCREKGVRLLPVDSEHSAIFQCLEGNGGSACGMAYKNRDIDHEDWEKSGSDKRTVSDKCTGCDDMTGAEYGAAIRRILLTASGGPFRGRSYESLRGVTAEQALKHPKWSMGSKITIDSATMMNKGLEVIEARWLFDVPPDKIDIHVHPESIVHSMVEFCDGSVMAQMGLPDMKIPISYTLNYPYRLDIRQELTEARSIKDAKQGTKAKDSPAADNRALSGHLDFFSTGSKLTFEKPDRKVFRCIDLAYQAIETGGSAPVVMNGANEELVAMFLAGNIGFTDIPETIEKVMDKIPPASPETVEEILEIDRNARATVVALFE